MHDVGNRYGDLLSLAFKTLTASAVAFAVACVLYFFVPFTDPIDVVGPPLMFGYSEAAEQWSLYGFWAATVVSAITIQLTRLNLRLPVAQRIGAVALFVLAQTPFLARSPRPVFAFSAAWMGAYFCGGHGPVLFERGIGPLRWPWLAVLIWFGGYHNGAVEALSEFGLGARIVVAAMILLTAVHVWGHRVSRSFSRGIGMLGVLAMLAAMWSAGYYEFWMGASAAGAYGWGVLARRKSGSILLHPVWLLFVLWTAATAYYLTRMAGFWPQVLRGIGGAGLGAVIHWLVRDWTMPVRVSEVIRRRVLVAPTAWLSGLALGLGVMQPRLAPTLAVVSGLFWLCHRTSPRRCRFWSTVSFGMLLAIAVTPSLRMLPLDHFHDGYNSSCVWEFENGRELYTEILPIRSYQFFVTWLSRRVLPTTVDAYLWTFSVLQVLPVLGAFALSMVWTRGSVPWSVATAITIAGFTDLDSRQAVHLLLAAMALMAFRRDHQGTWWLLGGGGLVAGCCGFDTVLPYAVASTLTLFFVPYSTRSADRRTLFERCWRAALGAMLSVVPFTAFIAIWQGPRAALEHWLVLRDFVPHFNAFSGLPIGWRSAPTRLLIGYGLVVLATWTTAGVSCWPRMSLRRCREWLFLMIQFGFLLHRGVGRSDAPHLRDLAIPSLVLLSLGLFTSVRELRRDVRPPFVLTTARVAWLVLSCVLTCAPFTLLVTGVPVIAESPRILRGGERIPLGEVPYVQTTVAPDETLWPIEHTTSNYVHRRHNPTRHPLAHIICSSSEQRRAVADLRRQPPRLIEWPTETTTLQQSNRGTLNGPSVLTECVIHSHDGIDAPLRYYIISQEVLPKYRPTEEPGFLEPAPPNWSGLETLPIHLNEDVDYQRLPLVWGEKRLPHLQHRILSRSAMPSFHPSTATSDASPEWELITPLQPRRFNRLLLTFTIMGSPSDAVDPDLVSVALQFTPEAWDDQTTTIRFLCRNDGQAHTYLVPVGCCPGWVWRSHIGRLRLKACDGCSMSIPRAEICFMDEITP